MTRDGKVSDLVSSPPNENNDENNHHQAQQAALHDLRLVANTARSEKADRQ